MKTTLVLIITLLSCSTQQSKNTDKSLVPEAAQPASGIDKCDCKSERQLIREGAFDISENLQDFKEFSRGEMQIGQEEVRLISNSNSGKNIEVVFEVIVKHQNSWVYRYVPR